VVGTETTRSRVAVETAFARSIALPPPTASRPSAPLAAEAISSIWSLGTSLQRPAAGRSSADQRSLAIRKGRSIPASPRSCGSSRRPQRTITPASPPPPEPLLHCNRRLAAAPPCRHGLLNGIASDASRELRAADLDDRLGSPRRRATGRAHERDLASRLEPLYAGGGEGARGQLGLDAGTGDEGDAEAGRGRALDRLLETELEPHVE